MHRDGMASGPLIVGFVGHGFRIRIGGQDHSSPGGILLSPESVVEWPEYDPTALTPEMLGDLLVLTPAPEFLLLGTGPGLVQPPRAFVRAIEARGLGVEVMDSRAAARAWGVLRAEDRRIIAALMPV